MSQQSPKCGSFCVCVCVCVLPLQGKFMMKLTAQRLNGEQPVCQMSPDEKAGTMKVKPTTFNAGVNVEASVLCPVCECEKVETLKFKSCRALAPIYDEIQLSASFRLSSRRPSPEQRDAMATETWCAGSVSAMVTGESFNFLFL